MRSSLELLGMAVLYATLILLSLIAWIHQSSILRTKQEEEFAIKVQMSMWPTDYFLWQPNGRSSGIDQLFAIFEGSDAVFPIGECMVGSSGMKTSFNFKTLNRFSALSVLELYQCELSDDQWEEISRNPTIKTVLLHAGTEISDHGRQTLKRAKVKVLE